MQRNIITVKDAAQEWVNGFNAIPYAVIEKICNHDIDSIYELTKDREGDYIYSYKHNDMGEIEEILKDHIIATIDGRKVKLKSNEYTVEHDSFLPMWGTLWTFGEWLDENWAKENLRTISNCGFRIYEQEDFRC